MGVDTSYLYGYGAEIGIIEWDLEYLKEKYKGRLDDRVNEKYSWKPTWKEFIKNMESAVESGDYYDIAECLEDIDHLINVHYDEECYITFDHTHLVKIFPESILEDLDVTAKRYAEELGIKNVGDIKWIEWGYFS